MIFSTELTLSQPKSLNGSIVCWSVLHMNSRIMLLVTCLFLFATSLNAEEPTLRLIPTGIITGPTDVVVEAVMPTEGSLELGAAVIVFQFDPSKVVISNPRASAGWDAPTTNNNTTAGLYHAVTCSATGLSATGPLLTLTVSPTGASADLSDCATFQLLGGDPVTDTGTNISASDENGFYSYYPPGSCGERGTANNIGDSTSSDTATGTTGGASDRKDGDGPMSPDIDVNSVVKALRIAGGLDAATPAELLILDWTRDGKVTILDAIEIARTPGVKIVSIRSFEDKLMLRRQYMTSMRRTPEVAMVQAQYKYTERSDSLRTRTT